MPPQPQQCQYCLPDSAYCIWRKVAEHCLPALPAGSMISPSNKSGKADRSTDMGVTTAHTSLVKPWARVCNKQTANSSHPRCPSRGCVTGSFGQSTFSPSLLHPCHVRHSITRQWECTPSNQHMCCKVSGLCPSGRPTFPHLSLQPLGRTTGRKIVRFLKGQKGAVVGGRYKKAGVVQSKKHSARVM